MKKQGVLMKELIWEEVVNIVKYLWYHVKRSAI